MASFLIRVEMHGASPDDYVRLHKEMEIQGCVRWITGDNGITYDLPTATYVASGTGTAETVRNAVLGIVRKVRPFPDPWVLAVAWSEASWSTRMT